MKATILTACRNCDRYLKDCIKSVLMQEYSNWEMIIVNDKSKDKSLQIMEKFAKRDKRIRVIDSSVRLRCGGAYSKALSKASGDICCVIDADDVLSRPDALSKLIQKYREHPEIDFIWTQFYICGQDLVKKSRGHSACPNLSLLEEGLQKTKRRHCFSHWRTFRTKLREKGMIFNSALPAAVDKWMGYTLEEIGKGAFYSKRLYKYRQRPGGLTHKGKVHWKRFMQEFKQKRLSKGIKPFKIIKI